MDSITARELAGSHDRLADALADAASKHRLFASELREMAQVGGKQTGETVPSGTLMVWCRCGGLRPYRDNLKDNLSPEVFTKLEEIAAKRNQSVEETWRQFIGKPLTEDEPA